MFNFSLSLLSFHFYFSFRDKSFVTHNFFTIGFSLTPLQEIKGRLKMLRHDRSSLFLFSSLVDQI